MLLNKEPNQIKKKLSYKPSIMVIAIGNGISDSSSIPGRGTLRFSLL